MTTTTGFGPAELRYLKRVETALLLAPRRDRTALLDLARRHVGERPPASSYDDLLDDLGPPDAYARQLMADEGVDPEPPRWRRLAARFRSRESMALTIGAVVVVGIGGWFLVGWFTEEPTITNSCSGAFSDDPGVLIEPLSAADAVEFRIGYVDGAEVRLHLCLSSSDTIEVLAIDVPDLDRLLFQPRDVLLLAADVQDVEDAQPFRPFTLGSDEGWWQMYVVGHLANCEFWADESSSSFDIATLTYRFRGRTRTMTIDLRATYAFEAGSDEACPRRATQPGAAASPGGT